MEHIINNPRIVDRFSLSSRAFARASPEAGTLAAEVTLELPRPPLQPAGREGAPTTGHFCADLVIKVGGAGGGDSRRRATGRSREGLVELVMRRRIRSGSMAHKLEGIQRWRLGQTWAHSGTNLGLAGCRGGRAANTRSQLAAVCGRRMDLLRCRCWSSVLGCSH
jgi:hypothetical protein